MHRDDPRARPAYELVKRGQFAAAAAHARRVLREEWGRSLNTEVVDEVVRWHIAGGRMDALRLEMFPVFAADALAAQDFETRERRSMRAYYFAQDILDHGDLDLALDFLRLSTRLSANPMLAHTVAMLESYQSLKDEAARRALPHLGGDRPRWVISSVVWGDAYIDNYMNYMVRSLLAPGNLPGLRDQDVHLSIVTTPLGRERIRAHPRFADVGAYAHVHFFLFPESLIQVGNQNDPSFAYYQLYGVMDHVSIAFARALGAGVLLLPVDCIVARGSLRNMVARIAEGYDAVGMTNIVAARERFLARIDERFGTAPVLSASARELANTALSCLHRESAGNLVVPENTDFSRWARDMFWPTEGGIRSRCVFVHPLCVSAEAIGRDFVQRFKWVDLYLSAALFPTPDDFGRFYLVPNSEEAYITNFATENRNFPGSGMPYAPSTFADGNKHAASINRWFLTQPQFIVCDTDLRSDRDPDTDVADVLGHMHRLNPL